MAIVKNIQIEFRSQVLLKIQKWEFNEVGANFLMGPSGSGKSTLLRILLGLLPCKGHQFIFKGRELQELSASQRNFGAVFQDYGLFPHMSAKQNILFALEARGLSQGASYKKIYDQLVEALKLEAILDSNVTVLSGGEQQRVALARGLVSKPEMIFMDEPFSALDAHLKTESRKLVQRILREFQIPALIVSHDMEDTRELPGAIFRIENKSIIAS